jgi:hypothetical protein
MPFPDKSDAAGDMALAALTERAEAVGIEALALSPRMGDCSATIWVRTARQSG